MIDILVAGAGPVGLALGVQLARFGLSFRIIEKSVEPTPLNESRALGVHSRTLEVFEDMGVIAPALEQGMRWHGLNAYSGGKRILHVAFEELDAPYPYLLTLPQSRTERILEARLEELGGRVERGKALASFEQSEEKVTATLQDASGRTEKVEARWLVGTDGAHSTVRHGLDLSFEGTAYEERFVLADVVLSGEIARDESHTWFSSEGPFLILPLPDGKARLLAQVQGDPEPTRAFFAQLLRERGPGPGYEIREAVWMASFKIHHRLVSHYRKGRVFIAGDACHIHSPVGGQGMNTGIQDVYNLSWKLAQAAKGGPDLLDSYELEPERRFFQERSGTQHTLLAVGMKAPALAGVKSIHVESSPRHGSGLYLVRPDGYVGFRGTDEKALRAHVARTVG